MPDSQQYPWNLNLISSDLKSVLFWYFLHRFWSEKVTFVENPQKKIISCWKQKYEYQSHTWSDKALKVCNRTCHSINEGSQKVTFTVPLKLNCFLSEQNFFIKPNLFLFKHFLENFDHPFLISSRKINLLVSDLKSADHWRNWFIGFRFITLSSWFRFITVSSWFRFITLSTWFRHISFFEM